MSPSPMVQWSRAKWAWLLSAALLGSIAGLLVAKGTLHACDCATPSWRVQFESATSSDPTVDHASYWFLSGNLTSYPGGANIWADGHKAGIVARVGATQ